MWDEIQTARRARRSVRWEARPHAPPRRERAAGLLLLLTELDMREARCGIGTPASALAGDCINAGINIAKRFGRAGCFVDFRHENLMLVEEERGRAARVSISVGMGPLIGIQRGSDSHLMIFLPSLLFSNGESAPCV
jgi:hypothetical protein